MGRKKLIGDEINPEIKKLYEDCHYSFNQISSKLNIHPETVKRRLKSMGILTRNLSQAMINFHKNKIANNVVNETGENK